MTKIAIAGQLPLRAERGPAAVVDFECRSCVAAFRVLFNVESLGGDAFAIDEDAERTRVDYGGRVRGALLFLRRCHCERTSADDEKDESKRFRVANHWFSFVGSSRWESTSSHTSATVLPDVSTRAGTSEYSGSREV